MIAVTGITGHTGSFFLEELVKTRFTDTVRCLVREGSNTKKLDESGLKIEKFVGNLANLEDVKELVRGADTVLHITNIRYSPIVCQAAAEMGVKRLVLVHTTGIYSKYKMASAEYIEIEKNLEKYFESGMDITILRPTMIFGDLCDHNIRKFIKMVDTLPVMPEINHGNCLIQPVNARDLGRAYHQVLFLRGLPERYYDVSGERPVSMHELFVLIGEYLGKRTRFISVPLPIAAFGARVVKLISLGKIDYVERVLRMGENRHYNHDNATRDFGYQPEEFCVGLKREVEEYLAHGRKQS